MLELVIVDDHPAVRSGLIGLLEEGEGLRVVASAATAREGFEAIADLRPDIALLDLHLPDDDGLSLCLRTRALPMPPRVVIYSAFANDGLAVRAAIAGASAVLAKSAPPHVLTAVLRGEVRPTVDPRALRALGARLEAPELAVLGMLVHGVAEEEVATTLGLTREQALARRAQILARLDGRRPLAAA
ncbi:response regulator transcription factor [Solirubrobacter sp. CPCC 204708]|uniref:Response regulator n=1 Tax=Solirubrobacter deserti TaxID=2282478 RepID=A0ABT4RBJ4_9ACTN|nr:response regulator [Solirubrobacter deserti]MBE2317211.1 response regulator transcription factor [Solirubrobacter deserti]MDA0135896.1 response regulator [Solirubrobacter deserti]